MGEREEHLMILRDAALDGHAELDELRAQLGAVSPHNIEDLIGRTMASVVQDGVETITFEATTGERWQMYYSPDCCAQCTIEDVVGDLQDLVGAPIAMAEESTSRDEDLKPAQPYDESFTWTFYKFATVKGYVTIRWYGSSNGYYSETASFCRLDP